MRSLILLAMIFTLQPALAESQLKQLKHMLQTRTNEPKLYLPDMAMIGTELNLLVIAPGAKNIEILASKEAGESKYKDLELRLSPDYQVIGKASNQDRANFNIQLDKEQYKDLIDKFYFFEALVSYEKEDGSEDIQHASFFGANANFSNNNAVRIIPEPEDNAGAANLARSLIPGLGQRMY